MGVSVEGHRLCRPTPGEVPSIWIDSSQAAHSACGSRIDKVAIWPIALGTSTGVQEIYSPQAWHLSVLTYEQTLFDRPSDLEAGRTPANVSFFSSPLCGYLQTNSACGSVPVPTNQSHLLPTIKLGRPRESTVERPQLRPCRCL